MQLQLNSKSKLACSHFTQSSCNKATHFVWRGFSAYSWLPQNSKTPQLLIHHTHTLIIYRVRSMICLATLSMFFNLEGKNLTLHLSSTAKFEVASSNSSLYHSCMHDGVLSKFRLILLMLERNICALLQSCANFFGMNICVFCYWKSIRENK